MESIICDSTLLFVMPNSPAIVPSAGATIDDDTGEMNVKTDTSSVAVHFLRTGQFLGFSGSSWPSHDTFWSGGLSFCCLCCGMPVGRYLTSCCSLPGLTHTIRILRLFIVMGGRDHIFTGVWRS